MRGILFLVLLLSLTSVAAETVIYQIKASYIYNFLQFVQFSKEKVVSDLNVCIIGENKFGAALDELDGASTPQSKINIRLINDYQEITALASCQVLYVVGANIDFTRKILSDINTVEVLTIGESSEFIAMGGYIELFIENDSIRFRINEKLAGNTQFKVAAQLLSLGISGS